MSKSKEQTGLWVDFGDAGIIKLIDWISSLSPKSRKRFLSDIIESAIYEILIELPGVPDMLKALQDQELNPSINVLKSYEELVERVEKNTYVDEEVNQNV